MNDVLSVSREKGVCKQIELLGRSFAGSDLSNYHVLKNMEIVYTKSPLAKNPYGIIQANRINSGIVSTMYAVYYVKEYNSPLFIEHYFSLDSRLNNYLKPLVNIGAKHDMKIKNSDVLKGKIYYPSYTEQCKISYLFEILNKKINVLESKIKTLKKYKKGLIQIGLNQVYSSDSFVRFSDLYVDINERNIDGLNQYTVGKEGLKPILESNYDLQNHKIFQPKCLLIGIGIEEIAVSVNDSGSVSPVYNVYKINNKDYLNYTRFFLKSILWQKKAFITRKSTRREYEIDTNELLRLNLPVPVDSQFGKVCKSIEALDILIQQSTNKLKQLNRVKSYLLKNMFI